ncbi:unnamed protein product, partial [Iphiclides podalirius]
MADNVCPVVPIVRNNTPRSQSDHRSDVAVFVSDDLGRGPPSSLMRVAVPLLALLLQLPLLQAVCPWACACRPTALDCSHRGLLHTPRRLPPDALRL